MEGCPTVFNCLQKYLQYMYNGEKFTAKIQNKSRFERSGEILKIYLSNRLF